MSATAEMPKYKCHKEVWALKIKEIIATDEQATIVPEDARYAPFNVGADYMAKHNPHAGGYYVCYKDGYVSYSPADAFEEGYSPAKEPGDSPGPFGLIHVGRGSFGQAIEAAKHGMRFAKKGWQPDVFISMQVPDENSKMTAPYLYVTSRFGMVPWIPTMIEILAEDFSIID